MKTLEIIIIPDFESTRDSMGFYEGDDYNEDAVLFQQGYDMDNMAVEAGDDFEIEEGYKGQISCEAISYKLVGGDEWDEDAYMEPDYLDLFPGRYRFNEDGITIERLT